MENGLIKRAGLVFCLAAALIGGAAARAEDVAGAPTPVTAAGDSAESSRTAAAPGAATPAPRAERHSPREGYPSLGPAGAKTTLIFFTDYQ